MAKNNKTRIFYVLYSDKTWVCGQSERATGPIYYYNTKYIEITSWQASAYGIFTRVAEVLEVERASTANEWDF